ncbi:MAG: NAD+ synthase [Persicimonas sp.]
MASSSPDRLRIAIAQRNYTVGDLAKNTVLIEESVERARRNGADLVVFSECALLGYPPRDMVERTDLIDRQLDALERIARLSDEKLGIIVGFIDKNDASRGKPLRNAAALCHGGRVVGRVAKRLLPTYDVFDEDRYFEPGDRAQIHTFKGVELGISVCEDAWNEPDFWERPRYQVDPIAEQVEAGAELLINIAASPFHLNKGEFRRRLLASHATSLKRSIVFANQIGAHDELIFDGRSLIVGPNGRVDCRLAEFEEDFIVREVPVGERSGAPSPHLRPTCESRAEQANRAVTLGIRDYFEKSGFSGAIIGVSGGIDSALTTALAAEALGADNILAVTMPTRYTRDISNEDAALLAENLGVEFTSIPIEDTFGATLDQLEPSFEGYEPDVTEENIQARIRGTTLMALSNKMGRLVLVPSNKSEIAMGYATLYGDMVGALSPLGDCLKTLVYEMARQLNEVSDGPLIPQRSIERAPSAELKPDQTDQDALPPYETLDAILTAYIHEGRTASKIVQDGFDPQLVDEVLQKLFRAEYKRWQTAPILKLTPKAFGIGWRFPLAASYDALRPDD